MFFSGFMRGVGDPEEGVMMEGGEVEVWIHSKGRESREHFW